ncbi:MAG TPA: Rho termination factor N-terminal domain-containing protein [Baekduia sp.]|uniref:Rho termination factor N-terminal domain-containing protein n=1 Tax=Baekduia sp. TaxID=2600305 RepID=UPI002C42783F|nr:Rho termination factor N-terminal domain-containing protein [Baekduia sp.]HMJ34052.1 Rho termination factor N-terminal domain-containing protein [Baekduia sp.]
MSVLTRSALEASPLADLHTIASEIGIDGFRRLRKADLVAKIIEQQGGEEANGEVVVEAEAPAAEEAPKRRTRGARGGRTRRKAEDEDEAEAGASDDAEADASDDAEADVIATEDEVVDEVIAAEEADAEGEEAIDEKPRRRSRGGRGRDRDRDDEKPAPRAERDRGDRDRDRDDRDADREDRIAEGTVELLPNGSGFVRVTPPEASDDDVYVSAAQIRRCELVSGDQVAGPVREPRRSERYPSLIRIDTINGRPADEVAEGTHFDDLPCTLPTERLALGSEDATLKAIEWLTPIGKGSRAAIVGEAHAGKSEALKRLAGALKAVEGLEVHVVLAAVRPEECAEWRAGEIEPAAALTIGASPDAQTQAVERAIDTAKRITARGGDVVVLIDAIDGLPPHAARRALGAARNIVDGGSLTVVATAAAPVGGETTIIALDRTLTRTGRFPALDLVNSGTLRPELLVGDAGADAIAQARAQALGA